MRCPICDSSDLLVVPSDLSPHQPDWSEAALRFDHLLCSACQWTAPCAEELKGIADACHWSEEHAKFGIEDLGCVSPDVEEMILNRFLLAIANDDGSAAQCHLDAGRPIYYCEKDTPPGLMIKEYPDRQRQLIRMEGLNEVVIRDLIPTKI